MNNLFVPEHGYSLNKAGSGKKNVDWEFGTGLWSRIVSVGLHSGSQGSTERKEEKTGVDENLRCNTINPYWKIAPRGVTCKKKKRAVSATK